MALYIDIRKCVHKFAEWILTLVISCWFCLGKYWPKLKNERVKKPHRITFADKNAPNKEVWQTVSFSAHGSLNTSVVIHNRHVLHFHLFYGRKILHTDFWLYFFPNGHWQIGNICTVTKAIGVAIVPESEGLPNPQTFESCLLNF